MKAEEGDLSSNLPSSTASPTPEAPPAPGAPGGFPSLERYEILEEIGRGAAGVVYRARDTLIGREVALKAYTPADLDAAETRAMFLGEARSIGQLSHPHIVTLYDVFETGDFEAGDGTVVIAMELIRGQSLKRLLEDTGGRLDFERTVDLVSQIASALDHLHAKGLVHRDIKPANLLLDGRGRVKLTDFGIALAGDAGLEKDVVLGTPGYMAPEQLIGREIDHRADVYSLGVVLYELLTGHRPYEDRSVSQLVRRIVQEPLPSPREWVPEIPDRLVRLLEKATAKDPAERHESAGEMARELRRHLYRVAGDARSMDESSITQELDRNALEDTVVMADRGSTTAAPEGSATAGAPRASASPSTPSPVPATGAETNGSGRPGTRWILAMAAGILLGILVVGGLVLWLGPEGGGGETAVLAPHEQLLYQGQLRLQQGEADEALQFFEVARYMAPDDPAVAEWIERAAAEGARAEGSEAVDPLALITSAREGLGASEQELATRAALDYAGEVMGQRGGRVEAVGPQTPVGPSSPVLEPESTLAETGPAEIPVTIEFHSDAPEGVVKIYADGRQLLREDFSYYESRGLWRKSPSSGSFAREFVVPSGASSLWVYVTRTGEAAQSEQVAVRGGSSRSRTLEVRLPLEGPPRVQLLTG